MSDHESQNKRVAAFLDGRMDAHSREDMLVHLAESDEDREVAVGAAAILRQLEEEDAAAALEAAEAPPVQGEGVIPLHTRQQPEPARELRRRAPVLQWLAAAAVLAGIALFSGRALEDRAAGEPVRIAARLEHGAEGLPAGWTEQRPWTSARGDDPGRAPTPGARRASSARAGAMLVDLSVAVEARDAAATRVLAAQLAARFDPQGGRAGPLREITDGAGGSPERLRPLVADATERIEDRLDRDALRLGSWTEAAALAATRRDAAFFRDRSTRRMLDRAGRLTQADPSADAALRQVRLQLSVDPPRWEALAPALDALARELATE
ncbi:MAG TPA: hypothetical protein VGB92_09475 [Longimicrobium sp.]